MVLVPVLLLSKTVVLPIAASIVALISLFEMFNCIGMKSKLLMTLPAYAIGIAVPICAKYMHYEKNIVSMIFAVVMLYLIYLLAISVLAYKKYTVNDAAIVFITSIYIIGGISSIVFLREMSESNIYLLVFVGAWMTDIFAYFTGRLFGKHWRNILLCTLVRHFCPDK